MTRLVSVLILIALDQREAGERVVNLSDRVHVGY